MRYYRSLSNLSEVWSKVGSIVAKALNEGFYRHDDLLCFLHVVPIMSWCQETHARAAPVMCILAQVRG